MFLTIRACAFVSFLLVSQRVYCQALSFDLEVTPENEVPLGTVVAASMMNKQGGTAPYTFGWGKCCKNSAGPGGLCPISSSPDSVDLESFCMHVVGNIRISARLEDSDSNSATRNVDVVVVGPDNAVMVGNPSSTGGPPIFQNTHKFRFKVGEKNLGPCYENCVYEKVALKVGANWEDDPDDWQLESCPGSWKEAFRYNPPEIVDVKAFNWNATSFATLPIGHVFREYKQWVGLKIAKCPPEQDEIFVYGPMHFKVIKDSATSIKHDLQ